MKYSGGRHRVAVGVIATISAAVLLLVTSLDEAAAAAPAIKLTKLDGAKVRIDGAGFAESSAQNVRVVIGKCVDNLQSTANSNGNLIMGLQATEDCNGRLKVTVGTGAAAASATTTLTLAGTKQPVDVSNALPKQNTGDPKLDFTVKQIATGLDHPWDSGLLPDGSVLVTERSGKLSRVVNGQKREVQAELSDVFAQGESGLMGLAVYPNFKTSRLFVMCLAHQENGKAVDNRIVPWRLSVDGTRAERFKPFVIGLPINSGGRHSGCRPTFGSDGMLYIGTGDSAAGEVPQNKAKLGGKVLRIDPKTGAAPADNPFIKSKNASERLVYAYGLRNAQGVAQEPGAKGVWISEHGPDVDDEVTRLVAGGNGGWNPVGGDYNENVTMTDRKYSNAMQPAWKSGSPTVAPSGMAFLGPRWGGDAKVLAVGFLKGQRVMFMRIENGKVVGTSVPKEFDKKYGRIRSIRSGSDGSLYITTDNGEKDVLLKVTPTVAAAKS